MVSEIVRMWQGRFHLGNVGLIEPVEIELLHNLIIDPSLPYGHTLEIGTSTGGTVYGMGQANAMSNRNKNEIVMTVDPYPTALPHHNDGWDVAARCVSSLAAIRRVPNTFFLHGTSATVRELVNRPFFRIIFIDGEHTPEAVLIDIQNTGPLLVKGGVMVLHDIANPAGELARPAWEHIINNNGIDIKGGRLIPDPVTVGTSGKLRWGDAS